jgi:hypothetical protein
MDDRPTIDGRASSCSLTKECRLNRTSLVEPASWRDISGFASGMNVFAGAGRFANLQDAFGSYNAKRRYLPGVLAERLGLRDGWQVVTNVIAALW